MIIDLNKIDVNDLFDCVINKKNRIDFYTDLRNEFQNRIENLLVMQGVQCSNVKSTSITNIKNAKTYRFQPIESQKGYDSVLDFDFCLRYGFDNYSLSGINYQHRGYDEIPSLLTFKRINNFSIGNIRIPLLSKSIDIQVNPSEQIQIVGFINDSDKAKRKPYIAIVGITFNSKSLNQIFHEYLNSFDYILDELKIKNVAYPILFICRKTGKIFTCNCFKNYISWHKDLLSRIMHFGLEYNAELKKQISSIEYLNGICHLCTGNTPNYIYGSKMYHSTFLVRYMPYYYLMNKKRGRETFLIDKIDKEKTENELRELFGHYKIGERWINETFLYNLVKEMFYETDVIFHYRGKELGGLEIDIWIPELKIGFEYQGIQHYQFVEHWGGEASLRKQQENDIRKKELCKINGYNLLEINYDESISKETIYNKLKGINHK